MVTGPGAITLNTPGTVTGNIYLNGNQVAHLVTLTQTYSSGDIIASCVMSHIMQ